MSAFILEKITAYSEGEIDAIKLFFHQSIEEKKVPGKAIINQYQDGAGKGFPCREWKNIKYKVRDLICKRN